MRLLTTASSLERAFEQQLSRRTSISFAVAWPAARVLRDPFQLGVKLFEGAEHLVERVFSSASRTMCLIGSFGMTMERTLSEKLSSSLETYGLQVTLKLVQPHSPPPTSYVTTTL